MAWVMKASAITEKGKLMADKAYNCKHFKWTSWNHYGVKMPEYACKLKGGTMGSCQGKCEKYERKKDG